MLCVKSGDDNIKVVIEIDFMAFESISQKLKNDSTAQKTLLVYGTRCIVNDLVHQNISYKVSESHFSE